MSRYKIGEVVPISAMLKITGVQHTRTGRVVYNTDHAFTIQENILDQMRIYQREPKAEKAEQEPKQDKSVTVKLYCVKDYNGGTCLKRGEVYVADDDGRITYSDGVKSLNKASYYVSAFSEYVVPLVQRPVKSGESVLMIDDDCVHANKKGQIAQAQRDEWLKDPTGRYPLGVCVDGEHGVTYLVLDGYAPEPEKCKCCGQIVKGAGE